MGVHNNVHIPEESWPHFLWYAIEFFIVLGISLGIGMVVANYFTQIQFKPQMVNWIFWGVAGAGLLIYYLGIRPHVFKKPIFSKI